MNIRTIAFLFIAPIVIGCAASGANNPMGAAGGALPDAARDATSSNTISVSNAIPASNPSSAVGSASYNVTNLGTLGGSDSSASSINLLGLVAGSSNLAGNEYSEAEVWRGGQQIPLGTLGGSNSGVDWPNHNNFGLVAGISETAAVDPLGEDWSCQAFFPTNPDTHHVCVGFAWRSGQMTALPTLGGINGYAAGTNDLGSIAGWAETNVHDSTCTAVTKLPNSFYQVLQFEPVVWGSNGSIHRLPTLPGDPDGAATATNDEGAVVGISGTCDQAVGRFTAAHAVIWEHGNVTNIGNFGGVSWNTPTAINNVGQVVGFANMPGGGDASGALQPIGFIWSKNGGLVKIPPLPGDEYSEAAGINDLGQVVGVSYSAGFATSRAFIWQNGKERDLNTETSNCSLYLLAANDINDRGQIVGAALIPSTGEAPAFLATPARSWASNPASALTARVPDLAIPTLPANVRSELERRFGMPGPTGP